MIVMAQSSKLPAPFPREFSTFRAADTIGRRSGQLWIAICLPQLALQSAIGEECRRREGEGGAEPPRRAGSPSRFSLEPCVIVDSAQGRLGVVAVNEAARSLGIKPGFNLNAAFGFSGSLRVIERSPQAERINLEALAAACHRLTPTVSLEAPDGVLLEVQASLKLFGGLASIKAALAQEIASRGFSFFSSVAPTALAALWLARNRSEDALSIEDLSARLSPLPLHVTRWPDTVRDLLQGMGVGTVGECLRLSRGGFARRIGRRYLEELDKALGRQPDLRAGFEAPDHLSFRLELLDGSTSLPVFVDAVTRMTEHLGDELRMRQAQIRTMQLSFRHMRHAPTVYRFVLIEACHERHRILDLLCDRLERMTLPAPATALELETGPLLPALLREKELFGNDAPSCDAASAVRLVERLRARFGAEAVYGLASATEHRPERAWSKAAAALGGRAAPPASSIWAHERPLWLLPVPRRVSCAGMKLERGPERIESGWWDGNDVSRDYFAATTARGEKLWIYRDLIERHWYLHGIFG